MSLGRVYVTRPIPEAGLELLRRECEVEVFPEEDRLPTKEEIIAGVRGKDALLSLLTEEITAEVMDAAPNLKVISNYAVGYNNIDVEAATARGIVVTNTPGVLTETTADLAWALLMAAARRLPQSERALRAGQWQSWKPLEFTGQDIYGATLGIVGLGSIGAAVARRALGFGMKILYYNRRPNPVAEAALGCRYVDLDTLLRESDFVSLHCPLTDETRGLIGRRELALMKPTAVLVNTARGPVVDEAALIDALKEGRIWAAGLDVYDVEPIAPDHPLLQLDNVVALPHIGSASIRTRTRMATLAAENLVAALTGKEPPTPVNPEVLSRVRGRP